jgi:hypothetical protein
MAALIDPSVLLFALLSAGLTIAVGVACPVDACVVESSGVPAVWALLALPAAGFAFALPRLRVQFFRSMWRVPSQTYLLPRWFVRLLLGLMLGQAAGLAVDGGMHNSHTSWLAATMALTSLALVAGAWKRFRNHPRTEFVMPWGTTPRG